MADLAEKNLIHMYGLVDADSFKQAQFCAKKLFLSAPEYFDEPIIEKMFEFEWEHFMEQQKRKLRGEMWVYKNDELIFINEELVGGYNDFLKWAENNVAFEDEWISPLYSVLTEEDYKGLLKEKNRDLMYMYISIDNKPKGHFLIELFNDIVPKTCENFKMLCKGFTSPTGLVWSYRDTIFHRIVPNGWIQGGDIINGNGSGGRSIYGETFEDENFAIPHDKRGILGMANHGRHTNASQFYITFTATPWMNCKYVAFGQLLEGTELLYKMEDVKTINEHPIDVITITKCAVLEFDEPIEDNIPDFTIGREAEIEEEERRAREEAERAAAEEAERERKRSPLSDEQDQTDRTSDEKSTQEYESQGNEYLSDVLENIYSRFETTEDETSMDESWKIETEFTTTSTD